jgi:hypothetical protein
VTMRCARPYRAQWEQILSRYGLSHQQLNTAAVHGVQGYAGANDPEMGKGWRTRAHTVDQDELSDLNTVPVREAGRTDIPEWSQDNRQIEAFLLHKYPSLGRAYTDPKDENKWGAAGIRQRAAQTAAIIYLAWRAYWPSADIADAFGLTEGAVMESLRRIRHEAAEFFKRTYKGEVVKDVLVHNCHRAGDRMTKRCACKLYIEYAEAKEQVRQGLADWQWVFVPGKKAFQTHGAIVAERAGKTPRVATLEKAQMQRASEGKEDDQEKVAAYGEMTLQWVTDLIAECRPDAYPGMPAVPMWADQRTGK